MNRIEKWRIALFCGLLICATALVSCASAATHTATVENPVEITLGPSGNRANVKAESRHYTIELAQVIDSRCPANAKCIWAGELAARIEIERTKPQAAPREITLGETSAPSIEIMGLRLELVSIDKTTVTFRCQPAAQP